MRSGSGHRRQSHWWSITPVKCAMFFVLVLLSTLGFYFYYASHIIHLRGSGKVASGVKVTTPRPVVVPPLKEIVSERLPIRVPANATQLEHPQVSSSGPKRVAVAITVTKDGPFLDGALVLGYAAMKYHSAKHGYPSKYTMDLVAFVTKKAVAVRPVLQQFGWKILERDLPVALDEIENQDYAQKMRDSGCCGADEFLKLWAYTLVDYDRVLHLDMDSIIFRNLDALFDIDKEFLFTGDYNMKGGSPVPPAQGGFLVIRPSMDTFREFQAIIRKGDHGSRGWGGSRIGNFWGGQTIQGIMPYFYHVIHPDRGQEMNRCQYNNMVDNPYFPNTKRCINGALTCEDCRASDPDQVYSAHFTICQKPWTCTQHLNPRNMVVCEAFHLKWFALRDEFERLLGIDPSYRVAKTRFVGSKGMCRGYGDDKYLPIPVQQVPTTLVSYDPPSSS